MFCNFCGLPQKILEVHHFLNSRRTRSGRVALICHKCHLEYHQGRNDFSYFGKLGADKKKKNGLKKLSFGKRGFKWQ